MVTLSPLTPLTVVFLIFASGVVACPDNCQCYRDRLTWTYKMDCTQGGLGLLDIPSSSNPSISEVILTNNFIKEIPSGSFSGYNNVQSLSLSSNLIERIDPDGLSGLTNLRKLTLSINKLTDISFLSGHQLPALEILSLDSNPISSIPPSVFESFTNLQILTLTDGNLQDITNARLRGQHITLSNNPIGRIGSGTFARLHEVLTFRCRRCAFRNVTHMGNMTGLHYLDLENNRITTIEEAAFDSLNSIELLHLSGNQITDVSPFRNIPKLRDLSLSWNAISHIPSDSFQNLPELDVLDLRSNRLSSFSLPLHIHQSLILSYNDLTEFNGMFLNLTSLLIINMVGNQNLQKVTIAGAASLHSLYMDNCTIQTLELIETPNLRHAFASYNDLRTLSSFHDLPELTLLKVSQNSIHYIGENGLVGLPNLNWLELSHNRLSSMPAFPNLPSLKTLDLSYNRIESLSFEYFVNLPNLEQLILTGNRLNTIPVFPNIEFLVSLILSENFITYFEDNPFEQLSSLTKLEMVDCNLTSISPLGPMASLQQLILEQNKISEFNVGFFYGLPSLQLLNLADNEITSLPVGLPIPLVNYLSISHNAISVIDKFAFVQSERLFNLDISHNMVESLDFLIYAQSQSLGVKADSNRIREFPITGILENVRYLSLAENEISFIPPHSFAFATSLYWLSLSKNQIRHISGSSFSACSYLSTLDLNGNPLESIDAEAFSGLTSLQFLRMANLPLQSFPENLFDTVELPNLGYVQIMNTSALITASLDLQYAHRVKLDHQQIIAMPNISAPRLQSISATYCLFTKIPTELFTRHPYLEVLRLSYNRIATINERDFVNAPKLLDIHLDNNRINLVAPGSFQPFVSVIFIGLQGNELTHFDFGRSNINAIQRIDLSDNPWRCDCRLESLKMVLMKYEDVSNPIHCVSPPELSSRAINSLQMSDLGCVNGNQTDAVDVDLVTETVYDFVTETVYDFVTETVDELMTEVTDVLVTEDVVEFFTFFFEESSGMDLGRGGDRDEIGPPYEHDDDDGDEDNDNGDGQGGEDLTVQPIVDFTNGDSDETVDWFPPCHLIQATCSCHICKAPSIFILLALLMAVHVFA